MAAVRALVLRDWTSRIMSGVFAAMVILGLLIAAHLLYAFQGRAFLLGLDVSVLMVASLAAVCMACCRCCSCSGRCSRKSAKRSFA
jgi:general stress protein CsbA